MFLGNPGTVAAMLVHSRKPMLISILEAVWSPVAVLCTIRAAWLSNAGIFAGFKIAEGL